MNQKMRDSPIQNSIIGILGGGQLGRMLAIAASRLGYKSHIFDPNINSPASQVSTFSTQASYDNVQALTSFAKSVDIVTYEFENIPTDALNIIEKHASIFPSKEALFTSQDRLVEKQFLTSLGLKTAPFQNIENINDLNNALDKIGIPAILKTRRLGYDGKGQVKINDTNNLDKILTQFHNVPCILEGVVNFNMEISIIGARDQFGAVSCYDPGENYHENGILKTTLVPAKINQKTSTDAVLLTGKILNELDYIGVLGVELFVTDNGLLINEIAPRVHNSGHWTQNGCLIDQFEQHIRAVVGLKLGDGKRHSNIEMINIIGDDFKKLDKFVKDGKSALHLYGKEDIKVGRKMGHINKIYEF